MTRYQLWLGILVVALSASACRCGRTRTKYVLPWVRLEHRHPVVDLPHLLELGGKHEAVASIHRGGQWHEVATSVAGFASPSADGEAVIVDCKLYVRERSEPISTCSCLRFSGGPAGDSVMCVQAFDHGCVTIQVKEIATDGGIVATTLARANAPHGGCFPLSSRNDLGAGVVGFTNGGAPVVVQPGLDPAALHAFIISGDAGVWLGDIASADDGENVDSEALHRFRREHGLSSPQWPR